MGITAIDPANIPPTLSREELEGFILFSIMVCNKEASRTRAKLHWLYDLWLLDSITCRSPFMMVWDSIEAGTLRKYLERVKTGQYTRIERAFREAILLDLDHLTVESLEAVHGIGPKTARFVLLYSQPNAEVVPLDTHVLKFLRKLGYADVPHSTPPAGPTYRKWEALFIAEARRTGQSVRELDTQVWQSYAKSALPMDHEL